MTAQWTETLGEFAAYAMIVFDMYGNRQAASGMVLLVEEILHQLICGLSHFLQGFIDPRWLFGISSIYSINHQNQLQFLARIDACERHIRKPPQKKTREKLITKRPFEKKMRWTKSEK